MSSVSLRLIRSATCGARDQPKGWQGISIARMPHHVRFPLDHRWITSPVAAVRFCYRTPVDVSMDRMQLIPAIACLSMHLFVLVRACSCLLVPARACSCLFVPARACSYSTCNMHVFCWKARSVSHPCLLASLYRDMLVWPSPSVVAIPTRHTICTRIPACRVRWYIRLPNPQPSVHPSHPTQNPPKTLFATLKVPHSYQLRAELYSSPLHKFLGPSPSFQFQLLALISV